MRCHAETLMGTINIKPLLLCGSGRGTRRRKQQCHFIFPVSDPPTFTSTVSKGFICDSSTTPITCVSLTGTNGTIFCDFESNPNGTLDPIMINAGGHVAVVGQNIHIIPATPGSTGNYICVATNIIQGQSFSSRREITLYVGGIIILCMHVCACACVHVCACVCMCVMCVMCNVCYV